MDRIKTAVGSAPGGVAVDDGTTAPSPRPVTESVLASLLAQTPAAVTAGQSWSEVLTTAVQGAVKSMFP